MEIRVFSSSELRAVDGGKKIAGYAAIFNSLSENLGGFREKIAPGAFANSLASGDDVRGLIDHNPSLILGRTKSGTLRLAEDSKGLRYEINPPDTQYARDLMESLKRGDVDQSSFGFRTLEDSWTTENGEQVRTLLDVKLFDVSAVTFPAYTATSVGLRALGISNLDEDEHGNPRIGWYRESRSPSRSVIPARFDAEAERQRLRERFSRVIEDFQGSGVSLH